MTKDQKKEGKAYQRDAITERLTIDDHNYSNSNDPQKCHRKEKVSCQRTAL